MINSNNKKYKYEFDATLFIKFLIPSLFGVCLFMLPIKSADSGITIPIAVLSGKLKAFLDMYIPGILTAIISVSFIGAVITKLMLKFSNNKFIQEHSLINLLFNVSNIWLFIRGAAFVFTLMTFYQTGFEAVYSSATGGLVFTDLLPVLFSIFLFAGLFLPLLLNFGLLEFVGALLVKVMRPVFNLPGRAAIDCIASWLGDGTIGVMLTSKQYEDGFYTEKEACVIGTSFSLVSLTFSLVVIDTVGLSNMFVPFYLTVTFASLVAAIVIPKLYPLRKKRNILFDGSTPVYSEESTDGYNGASYGLKLAIEKAKEQNIAQCIFKDGTVNVLDMWFAVIPVVMAVGTFALIIAEYTPVFRILGLPFLPLLKLLQIPDAVAASQTLIAGFADMLLPSILISGSSFAMTKFIVACVSVTQLIYLSEVGALILGSKIPLNLRELFIIFIERTLITLPIIAAVAHILF